VDISLFINIAIASILVSNLVLTKFLGLCPFIGVTRQTESALGMGAAVTFVMFLASVVTYFLYQLILVPTGLLLPLKNPMYILVIATLVQLVEMFLRSKVPELYHSLGVYLPLITTNCAVLGLALLNTTDAGAEMKVLFEQSFSQGLLAVSWRGICAGAGFSLAMLLMSGIRERLDYADVPDCFEGVPIAFISAAFMAMAFLGFSGLA